MKATILPWRLLVRSLVNISHDKPALLKFLLPLQIHFLQKLAHFQIILIIICKYSLQNNFIIIRINKWCQLFLLKCVFLLRYAEHFIIWILRLKKLKHSRINLNLIIHPSLLCFILDTIHFLDILSVPFHTAEHVDVVRNVFLLYLFLFAGQSFAKFWLLPFSFSTSLSC